MAEKTYSERFRSYFEREVAEKAASTLANGVEMGFEVGAEKFHFTREAGRNQIRPGEATDPQISFVLTEQAADEILADPSDEIAQIGINIAKLVVTTDARRRVSVRFQAGFLKLWSKGYFGVLKSGGSQFASHLASMGLSGMDAIKAALGKSKGSSREAASKHEKG